MAPPVTEIVEFALPSSADVAAVFPDACKTLTQQPGCRAARYSVQHEDASKLVLYVDWDSISAHEAFAANADVYKPFLGHMLTFHNAADAGPLSAYHVAFDPPAKDVLDVAPAVEVLHLHFPADYDLESEQETVRTISEFLAIARASAGAGEGGMDLLVGPQAVGWAVEERVWKEEKVRVLVVMIGWHSVEAHMKYRDTDAFRESIGMIRGLKGMKGINVYHVACAKA
ncbi:hypothetical protein PG995_010583 [Apiospora arundinis]